MPPLSHGGGTELAWVCGLAAAHRGLGGQGWQGVTGAMREARLHRREGEAAPFGMDLHRDEAAFVAGALSVWLERFAGGTGLSKGWPEDAPLPCDDGDGIALE